MHKFIIPTMNAAAHWPLLASALLAVAAPADVLILDSESTDGTSKLAHSAGFELHTLNRRKFNHGATRQLGVELASSADLFIFMTQDAVLASPGSLAPLLQAFADPTVGAAYGRQLPRPLARGIEGHARLFNYPAKSKLKELGSREQLGFKTIFISNSFAAYRRSALAAIGGFPSRVIFGEDTITAARLLLADWKIAYVAEATVFHSHAYSWGQEFRRYFDIGVLHSRERWLLDHFGEAGGEGKRFVLSELNYLWREDPLLIPSAMVRTGLKVLGYRLGRAESRLKPSLKRRLSMQQAFWAEQA